MSSNNPVSVDLLIASDAKGLPNKAEIEEWVGAAMSAAEESEPGELSVRLVDKAESRALNKEYRGKDKPTNVLSFPFDDMAGLPEEETRLLGDLVICAPVVRKEAKKQDKRPKDHWAHMVVHGTLHLLGYDHIEEAEASEMEALEARILEQFGISNPY